MPREIERRVVGGEVRALKSDDAGPTVLEGYGAVFGQETVIAGMFRERVAEGAFADAMKGDVRAAFNHSPDLIIGRTVNGTLRLREDKTGLRYEIDLNPNDPDAQRIAAKVARGDVDQSSFSFSVSEDGEEWDYSETKAGKLPLRTITRIEELYDTGPVAFAAYPQTSVSARARELAAQAIELANAAEALARAEAAEHRAAMGRLDARRRRLAIAEAEGK